MAFKDLMIQLTSYPEPTGVGTLEQAVSFAEAFGARLTALTFEIRMRPPIGSYPVSGYDLVSGLEAEQEKSRTNARNLVSSLEELASRRGVSLESILECGPTAQISSVMREYAQVRDLTMIPLPETRSAQHWI